MDEKKGVYNDVTNGSVIRENLRIMEAKANDYINEKSKPNVKRRQLNV
jgi:hypothetical protein